MEAGLETASLPEGDRPSYPIGSVDNALRLLSLFSEHKSVRIADASRTLGVARSTAHRMVQMLQYRGFVSQNPETKAYVAGPELVRMALAIVQQVDLRTVAQPVMYKVLDSLNETVHLTELRGSDIFFIDSIESTRSVRVGQRTGMLMPAHSTAAGKAMLSALDTNALHALYPSGRLRHLTDSTVKSRKELEAELEQIRAQGYAVNFGESEAEVHSVAAPIYDVTGRIRAALAIAAPPSRLGASDVEEIAATLIEGAKTIGELLAG